MRQESPDFSRGEEVNRDLLDEGIVWHAKAGERLSDGLYNELGGNRCFKIINNKYLTKHGL